MSNDLRHDTALRRLVDRVPDVVFRFSLRPAPRVEYISEATLRVTGYAPDEFYADPGLALAIAHPDDRGRLRELVRTGGTSPETLRYVCKDGSVIWAEVRLSPFYEGGEIAGADGVVRRVDDPAADGVRVANGIRIDVFDRTVTVDGQLVSLTPAELKLLVLLVENAGETVTRDQMMRHLWRSAHTGDGHTCEAHISNLRKKIEPDPRTPTRILTIRGRGYRLVP